MRNIVLTRIDERLIHGQVCTAWLKETNANTILVIDNPLSKDDFAQQVLRTATPAGTTMKVMMEEEAAEYLQQDSADGEKIMILVKKPEPLENVMNAGVAFTKIILGNMSAGPGRKRISKSLSASDAEMECMRRIKANGVDVVFQQVPYKAAVPLEKL